MRTAMLPGGIQMQFPDGTPDPVMDQAVQRYIQIVNRPQPSEEAVAMQQLAKILSFVIPEAAATMSDSAMQTSEADTAFRQSEMQLQAAFNKSIISALQMLANNKLPLQAAERLAPGVESAAEGVAMAAQALEFISRNSAALPNLVKAINALSITVSDSAQAIIAAMVAQRNIIRLPDGTPDGLKIMMPQKRRM